MTLFAKSAEAVFRPLSDAFIRRTWYSVLQVLDTCTTLPTSGNHPPNLGVFLTAFLLISPVAAGLAEGVRPPGPPSQLAPGVCCWGSKYICGTLAVDNWRAYAEHVRRATGALNNVCGLTGYNSSRNHNLLVSETTLRQLLMTSSASATLQGVQKSSPLKLFA